VWPRRYFAGRYFPPRYFPQSQGAAPSDGSSVRAIPAGAPRVTAAVGAGTARVRVTAVGTN
jgi:hypothetical protein